jgi:hypothetical protein
MPEDQEINADIVPERSSIERVHKEWRAVMELMVAKKGNYRMVVRFNNKDEPFIKNKNFYEPLLGDNDWRGYRLLQYENVTQTNGQVIKKEIPCRKMTFTDDMGNRRPAEYAFERILTTQTQSDTFDCVKPFVLTAMEGTPTGIFAYGGTGSGKTHTMIGEKKRNYGLIPRVVREIGENEQVTEAYYDVVEIFCEKEKAGANVKYRLFDLALNSFGEERERYVKNPDEVGHSDKKAMKFHPQEKTKFFSVTSRRSEDYA